eukprot:766555-Hanusia_phi.AAC.5
MTSTAFPVSPVGCDLSIWRQKLEKPHGRASSRNDRKTYVMQVSYLGSNFSAVQRCPGHRHLLLSANSVLLLLTKSSGIRTVQEEVEKALKNMFANSSTSPQSLVAPHAAPAFPSACLRYSLAERILESTRMGR